MSQLPAGSPCRDLTYAQWGATRKRLKGAQRKAFAGDQEFVIGEVLK